jgi:hypothetical protein
MNAAQQRDTFKNGQLKFKIVIVPRVLKDNSILRINDRGIITLDSDVADESLMIYSALLRHGWETGSTVCYGYSYAQRKPMYDSVMGDKY